MRLPQPIVLTVDNITAPVNASLKFIQHTNMQIYQASCMQPLSRITFTCSQWREMESCHNLSNVDTFYTVDTDLILFLANTSEYIQRKPVFDRLGRGRVEIASVPLQWNYAEVACHRTVHLLDAKQSILVDQYSSAVRLCVSEMSFRFYVTHVGFDLDKGLTMSLAELKEMGAVTELEMGRINKVEVGSAVLCEVTEGTSVNYTEIKYLNAKDKPIDAYLMFKYASVALIVLLETGRHKNEFIDLYCQSGGENSRIPSKSNVSLSIHHHHSLTHSYKRELEKRVNSICLNYLPGPTTLAARSGPQERWKQRTLLSLHLHTSYSGFRDVACWLLSPHCHGAREENAPSKGETPKDS